MTAGTETRPIALVTGVGRRAGIGAAIAERYTEPFGSGRIIALTSDHTAGNLPYGASKGALDRITLAAARELADLGVTANAVDPGPVQTGWIDAETEEWILGRTPLGR